MTARPFATNRITKGLVGERQLTVRPKGVKVRDERQVRLATGVPQLHDHKQDPTERVEATTTPEVRRGWDQPRHPELMGEGSPRQESGTGATTGGVRAEARRANDRAGGIPGSAPVAASDVAAPLTAGAPMAAYEADNPEPEDE